MAFSKLPLKSSSLCGSQQIVRKDYDKITHCAVFSMIGIVKVSKYPMYPPVYGLGIALICSMFAIDQVLPFVSKVHRTAAWE